MSVAAQFLTGTVEQHQKNHAHDQHLFLPGIPLSIMPEPLLFQHIGTNIGAFEAVLAAAERLGFAVA